MQTTLDEIVTVRRPRRIIRDRAHDSDPLNEALADQGIGLVAPHWKNRKKAPTQDMRVLRRQKNDEKLHTFCAWLNKSKKAITRWEHCVERYIGLVYPAFSMALLRRIIKSGR